MDNRRCLLLLTGFLGSLVMVAPVQSEDIFEKPLSVLEQWIETENVISRERSDWAVEQAAIEDLLQVHKQELESLKSQIDDSEAKTTEADKQRAGLLEQEAALKSVSANVSNRLVEYEQMVRNLVPRLPDPLRKQVDTLYSRLPADSEDTRMENTVRMQIIIGILTQIDKFNNTVEIASEFRTFEDSDQRVLVDVLYFGLGIAYFADESGKHTGIKYPTEDGWKFEDRNDLASDILETLKIYKLANADARFIPLPVKIR